MNVFVKTETGSDLCVSSALSEKYKLCCALNHNDFIKESTFICWEEGVRAKQCGARRE